MSDLKSCLSIIFECAMDDDIVAKSPAKNLQIPQTEGKEQIEVFCPHMTRHTYRSLAYPAGADVKIVSQILGHASTSVTPDRYTHLTEEEQKGQETVIQTVRISWSLRRSL